MSEKKILKSFFKKLYYNTIYHKKYYLKRKQKILENQKEYNKNNINSIREYQKNYNIKNREKKRENYNKKKNQQTKVVCDYCNKSYVPQYIKFHIFSQYQKEI